MTLYTFVILVLLQCFKVRVKVKVNNARLISEAKAIDKWVLGGAETPPNFWHFYVMN